MKINEDQIRLVQRFATLLEKYLLAYRSDPERGNANFPNWLRKDIARPHARHLDNLLEAYKITVEYTK